MTKYLVVSEKLYLFICKAKQLEVAWREFTFIRVINYEREGRKRFGIQKIIEKNGRGLGA